MSLPAGEPATPEAVREWIEQQTRKADRFRHVAEASDQHRAHHGCTVYPSSDGSLLGVLAAASRAGRVLEVGCGLGYSALWLAYGAGAGGSVETIERDRDHAELARRHFAAEGMGECIKVHIGRAAAILPTLRDAYDLIYFDGEPAESLADLEHFVRLLRPGGLLISANLFLGQYDPTIPGLEQTAEYRVRILNSEQWLTAYCADGDKALSIRR